ncbi:D-inositol-3-phosphate glycosyltransferase [Dyadobacter sp. CECT 9275]|uniref:D-inositol-3-phosphate glycosyltransferase n=1 Tax=Dyadobacter helix TaxID=2822344 RepID=A0A916JAD1_9BACT|nr:glycosyltransferase family 4 protein [Dyadobacter sp. CECT 9275]CAG4995328.1 D-inositol-3-phosphate glycosyltransferase [Dyadobacter sp. CECT 9275]
MRIICLHQSADLYGSDRSFLQVVEFLKGSGQFSQITVVLPRSGPLSEILESLEVEVIFVEMSLLSKTYLKKFQWGKIIFPLLAFRKKLELIKKYDILYVNTSVILDFYVLAPFLKLKKMIHIREIPAKWLGKILSVLIARSNSLVIFNSYSTQQSFDRFQNSMVIHNAFEGYDYSETSNNSETPDMTNPLKILLIGRINTWKGQDFVIRTLSKLAGENFRLRIVGSTAAGNEELLVQLRALTNGLKLDSKIEFIEFAPDPSEEYKNADLVIVPSTKPEPFGRIAIEAMSVGKPVLAANHGGLPEIIVHGENGFLFEPGNADSFNEYLLKYLINRDLLLSHGIVSRALFLNKFSVDKMHKQLGHAFFVDNILNSEPNETI